MSLQATLRAKAGKTPNVEGTAEATASFTVGMGWLPRRKHATPRRL